jgi:hypothetical protein
MNLFPTREQCMPVRRSRVATRNGSGSYPEGARFVSTLSSAERSRGVIGSKRRTRRDGDGVRVDSSHSLHEMNTLEIHLIDGVWQSCDESVKGIRRCAAYSSYGRATRMATYCPEPLFGRNGFATQLCCLAFLCRERRLRGSGVFQPNILRCNWLQVGMSPSSSPRGGCERFAQKLAQQSRCKGGRN